MTDEETRWVPGRFARAVLTAMSIDRRDVRGPHEVTGPALMLGFALFTGLVAAVTFPVGATVVSSVLAWWGLAIIGLMAGWFITSLDIFVVSAHPEPRAKSVKVLADDTVRVLVAPMPGLGGRIKSSLPRLAISVFIAIAVGTLFTLAMNMNSIEVQKDEASVREQGANADIHDARHVAETKTLTKQLTVAERDATKAQAVWDRANKVVKCQNGELAQRSFDGVVCTRGGPGLAAAQSARRTAQERLTSAQQAESRARTKLERHLQTQPPSKRKDYTFPGNLDGLDRTMAAYRKVTSKLPFLEKFGAHLFLLVLDATPLILKILRGWTDVDRRRWFRIHHEIAEERTRAIVLDRAAEERIAAADATWSAAASPELRKVVQNGVVEEARIEAQAKIEQAKLQAAFDVERKQRDIEIARAGLPVVPVPTPAPGPPDPDPWDLDPEPDPQPDPVPDPEPDPDPEPPGPVRSDPLDPDQADRGWGLPDEDHPRTAPIPTTRAHFYGVGNLRWLIGPKISSASSANQVFLAVRAVEGPAMSQPEIDRYVDVRAVKLLSADDVAQEEAALAIAEGSGLFVRPELNSAKVHDLPELMERVEGTDAKKDRALIFEYFPRTDAERYWLSSESRAYGSLTYRRLAEWGISVARALGSLWAREFVHNDVKPANSLVRGAYGTPSGANNEGGESYGRDEVVLSDLFLVSRIGLRAGGTHAYLEPACALSTFASDAFALGASLYVLLTGITPNEMIYQDRPEGRDMVLRPGWSEIYSEAYASGRFAAALPASTPERMRTAVLRLIHPDADRRVPVGGKEAADEIVKLLLWVGEETGPGVVPTPAKPRGAMAPAGWSSEIRAFIQSCGYALEEI